MRQHVEIDRAGGVQRLRLSRPEKRNALVGPMYEALADALEGADADGDTAVSLLMGVPGAFSAGNDITDFMARLDEGRLSLPVMRFLGCLARLRKPLIAAVDGIAVGIGTTLLLHCDLVYASPAARFRTPFLDLGLVPEAASSLLMPRRMGHVRAFEMLCLGVTYDASQAQAAGLVNAVLPSEELEAHALAAARSLAAKPREALMAARRLLRGDPAEVEARIAEEAELFRERLRSPEAREAFTAFLEKRPPDFARLRQAGRGSEAS